MREDVALSPRLRRTFAALADAVLPEGGAFPEGASTVDVAGMLARLWPDMQRPARRRVAALLVAVDMVAVLRTGRRFAGLSAQRRLALCETMEQRAPDAVRGAFIGLKTIALVLAMTDSRLQARLGTAGWPPQLIGQR
jgi:hypothetical protein